MILDVCVPSSRTSKYLQKLVECKEKQNGSTVIVENFNSPVSDMGRSSGQKMSQDVVELNNIYQLNTMDIWRPLHSTREHSSQACMEQSPKQTTFWVITHTLRNVKQQKAYNVRSPITVELNQKSIAERQWHNPQYLEIKQYLQITHESKKKSQEKFKNASK